MAGSDVHERQLATTIQRSSPKISRNDPRPCGSGMKFKKCCGAAAALH
ncbi:SEC-C metal-binding domain-containing protein [Cupriavidus basilensis]|nr:SEC-C metal-binding domain-containing protein [Cupriavidus basilensis]